MNFTSLEFLLFFPIVMLVVKIAPSKIRWCVLLFSSYFFYFYWNPWTILLLIVTTLVSYISAIKITSAKTKKEENIWLILVLIVSLGFLGTFKYLSFFLNSLFDLLSMFGIDREPYILNIFLPIGISFYTFQTLSYVIDVYKKEIEPERHLGYYALFVSYFPQLVAGPIERPSNLLPQLKASKKICKYDVKIGLEILLRGFFKKLVIADFLGGYVDRVYSLPNAFNGIAILIATIMFAFQIYCDFSGYSDIAVGIARMMGIKLMKNFDKPYSAINIQDFWKRWHISLTSWFRDYVYKPLGGSHKGFKIHCINTMIVFFISGLWHGAAWNYILWGCIHGFYMVVYLIFCRFESKCVENSSWLVGKAKQLGTFSLISFSWIYFRAESITDANLLVLNIFSGWDIESISNSFKGLDFNFLNLIYIIFALLSLGKLDNLETEKCREGLGIISFLLLNICMFAWLSLLSVNGESSFIYFRF